MKKAVRAGNSDFEVTHIHWEVVRMGMSSEGKNIKRERFILRNWLM